MMRWFDCNGVELHQGDTVRDVNSGVEELVYACHPKDQPDELNLGLNASNERFLELHPEWEREIYPFHTLSYVWEGDKRCLLDYEKVV
jgi:hypothetical protein